MCPDINGRLSNEILWRIRKNSIEWTDDKHMSKATETYWSMNRKHEEEMVEEGTVKRLVPLRGVIWRCGLGWIEGHADFFRFGAMRTRDLFPSHYVVFLSPSRMQWEIWCGYNTLYSSKKWSCDVSDVVAQIVLWPTTFWSIEFSTLITQHELQLTMHEFSLGLEFGTPSFCCLFVFSRLLGPWKLHNLKTFWWGWFFVSHLQYPLISSGMSGPHGTFSGCPSDHFAGWGWPHLVGLTCLWWYKDPNWIFKRSN